MMRLVPIFILETNNECLLKFVSTDNTSSPIKWEGGAGGRERGRIGGGREKGGKREFKDGRMRE